ncbi:MAG: hypothetical protein LBV01_01985, partial [Deltaproteobacteria bacterium]|nr:hypothetical protein [Deltaproteobacteria bacterium]
MADTVKKNAHAGGGGLALLVFCALVFFPGAALSSPYSLTAAFYRAGEGTALAVTLTPTREDVYLYASESQAKGRPSRIGAFAGDTPLGPSVVFPRGAEKADPLVPGAVTRAFAGALTAWIPVDAPIVGGTSVAVRFSGLACSPVTCTPLDLALSLPAPEPFAATSLAEAPTAAAAWEETLRSGVREPMPARDIFRDASAPLLSPAPGIAVKKLAPAPAGAFLARLAPVPFTPALEVNSLGKAVLLGLLAGLLLNFMPCVLPVIGIKISALLRQGEDKAALRRFRRHQLFFALGILAWFSVLSGLFHGLNLAWGQIFQSPAVVFILAVFLLLLALNLFGAFSLPVIDLTPGNPGNPDVQAFVGGFSATLLATPCGGPLLGGVLSWALMQPLGILALVVESVGLGMALPYLALAAFPGVASRFPRPGGWMGVL